MIVVKKNISQALKILWRQKTSQSKLTNFELQFLTDQIL